MSVRTERMTLNMGPNHPSTHGVLRLELEIDGEQVIKVTPHLGYLHRCFEKHAESMMYNQVVPYTDRLDYCSSMYNNWSYAIAAEKLLGIQVSERVEYIRVIMGELQRIASHIIALGSFGLDLGAWSPFLYLFRDREHILTLFEMTCGARLLYNYIWVGGLSHDIHPDFLRMTREFVNYFQSTIDEVNNLLSYNKIFIERTANIGVLPLDTAINFGCTGPLLRGSGLAHDLRKDDPYSVYSKLDFNVCVGQGLQGTVGDTWDRYFVRIQEMQESLKIIKQALDQIPAEGDVQAAIPKRIKPPKGTAFSRVENPRGELGFFIISDGNTNPFRVKVKPPSFINLQILSRLCEGHLIADIMAILGSIDIVLGEVDR